METLWQNDMGVAWDESKCMAPTPVPGCFCALPGSRNGQPPARKRSDREERLRVATALYPRFLDQYHYNGENILKQTTKKLAALDAVEAADELIAAVDETQ